MHTTHFAVRFLESTFRKKDKVFQNGGCNIGMRVRKYTFFFKLGTFETEL